MNAVAFPNTLAYPEGSVPINTKKLADIQKVLPYIPHGGEEEIFYQEVINWNNMAGADDVSEEDWRNIVKSVFLNWLSACLNNYSSYFVYYMFKFCKKKYVTSIILLDTCKNVTDKLLFECNGHSAKIYYATIEFIKIGTGLTSQNI